MWKRLWGNGKPKAIKIMATVWVWERTINSEQWSEVMKQFSVAQTI